MQTFEGYSILKQIFSSAKTSIYHCIRQNDQTQLLIKMLNADYPDQQDIATLKHEYNLIKNLDLPSIIHTYGLEQHEHKYGLILENLQDAYSLNEMIAGQEVNIDKFLSLSIKLADALHELHSAHIIHKDINPFNILISKKTGAVKLIDFSIATQLSQEVVDVKGADVLEGTYAYMSPEQTRRTNHAVDERSDLYSLGITLYEMLTGHVPFEAADPIGWVHCHIAKQPKAPNEINKDIPQILSAIVMKLLSKTPEDRYSSAYGLKADLERCLFSWQTSLQIKNFTLGEKDRKSIFHIPEKLYGREAEVQSLLNAFERTSQGARELLLVLGSPGIGKSSLVNEVHKPIVKQRGYFAAGKFEQYHHVPYEALIQAFRKLVQQILTENKERIDSWRTQLLNALASNGQIIIDVIPELELLIGKQPPVSMISIIESRNRFELVFFEFIRVFAKAEHPLTIYLDDLQWTDVASCNLIKEILRDKELHHFLIIGSYRDNEVSEDHPLMDLINEIKKTDLPISNIKLKPLSLQNTKNLISDTLNTEINSEYLAKLVQEKTGGNPFFIKLFLTNLYQDKHIYYDLKIRQWVWDINSLRELSVTDNMVDLVISNIERLPLTTQDVLKIAACIGNRFELGILALATNQTIKETANVLWNAMKANLIIPMSDNYKLVMADSYYENKDIIYKFSHDRIQQAAYLMMPEEQRKLLHLKLGHLLLEKLSDKEKEEQLFDIVNHFNESFYLVVDPKERLRIANLNLDAGLKAKHYAAYTTAENYFKKGLELLKEDAWEKYHQLSFNLNLEYAETKCILAKFEEADKLFNSLLERTTIPLEKAKIIFSQLLSYQMQSDYDKTIDLGLKGLGILGLQVPRNPSKLRIAAALLRVNSKMKYKSPEELVNLPILNNPEIKLIFDYLQKMAVSLYAKNPNLDALLSFYCLEYAVKYGNTASGITTYLTYAAVLSIQFKNYELAYRYGQMTLELAQRFGNLHMMAVTYCSVALMFSFWKDPYKKSLELLNQSYFQSRQSGELLYANYGLGMLPLMMFIAGTPLSYIENKLKSVNDFIEYCNHHEVMEVIEFWKILFPILHGDKRGLEDLKKCLFKLFNDKLPFQVEMGVCVYGISLMLPLYFLEDWDSALNVMDKIDGLANKPEMRTMFCITEYYFYRTLIFAHTYQQVDFLKQLQYKMAIKTSLNKFKAWAKLCPENFKARYLIMLTAVAAFLEKDMQKANAYYEEAIATAQKYEQTNLIAIVNELLAKALLAQKQAIFAKSLIQEAIYAYQTCGIELKVEHLKVLLPNLISNLSSYDITSASQKTNIGTVIQTKKQFDLSTVIKSSQLISSRVQLKDLLQILVHIMLENAGAERGLVLLFRNDKLFIEAEGIVSENETKILQHQVVEKHKNLCLSVIQYVQNTKKSIVLNDAANEGNFIDDPYVINNKTVSILCFPIMQQDKMIGVLYLENNLIKGAFTTERFEVLKLLASQMAISLENALLYSAYDQFVPHEFLELLAKRSIMDIQLGDHIQKYMTVLFSDIRDFTKISEKMPPNEVFLFINDFLGHMEPIIKKHHGFIDKYIGDAIMALFPGEANDAVLTGIDMQKELRKFNQKRAQQGQPRIKIGIGINSGSLMLGTLGSGHRLETSVLSDAVNVAARIEELTKEYGSQLLISEWIYEQLNKEQRLESRFVGKISIRGKEEEVNIWEVFSGEPDELRMKKIEIAEIYNQAINLFYQNKYQKALLKFESCQKKLPNDKVIKIYIFKCNKFIKKNKINL